MFRENFTLLYLSLWFLGFNIVNTRTESISRKNLLPVTPKESYYLKQCPWTISEFKKNQQKPQKHKPSAWKLQLKHLFSRTSSVMLFPLQGKLVYSDSPGCGTATLGKPFMMGICSVVVHTQEIYILNSRYELIK